MEEVFNGWMLAGGAAVLTIVATGWTHVKSLYSQIAGRVVVRITTSGYQADAILLYLKHHFTASRFGPRAYVGWKLFVRPQSRVQLVSMEIAPPSGRVYWRGWCPIWIAKSKENVGDLEEGLQAAGYDYQTISITFARGTMDPDKLISDATNFFNEHVRAYESTGGRRHSIRFIHGTAGNTAMVSLKPKGGSSSPTSNSDIRACLGHRPLAEDLDLPIFVYDLATLKNDELLKAWNQMLSEVPCMALMEDIDAVFDHRKNIAVQNGPGLTFDCLLNCLDGV